MRAARGMGTKNKKSKMADSSETNAKESCEAIKNAINLKKLSFERKISSGYKLKELDQTFRELNWLAENIVEGNL